MFLAVCRSAESLQECGVTVEGGGVSLSPEVRSSLLSVGLLIATSPEVLRQLTQVYLHDIRLQMSLYLVDHVVDTADQFVRAVPGWLELR